MATATPNLERALAALSILATEAEVRAVFDAARSRLVGLRAQTAATVALALRPGACVAFKGRGGGRFTGVVEKVNRTTAHVKQKTPDPATSFGPSVWRVPLAALTIIPSQEA